MKSNDVYKEVEKILQGIGAEWVSNVDLEEQLQKKVKKKGFLSKTSLENLDGFSLINRPFRKVTFNVTRFRTQETSQTVSLIDEGLAPLVEDADHRMLLWRPRYVNLTPTFDLTVNGPRREPADVSMVQSVVEEMIEHRWTSQMTDDEMSPKLKRLQADPISAISFLIPRTPGGLRKEKALIDERKVSHAYVLANSLVTNSSPRDIITSVDVGESVLIETIIATYRTSDETKLILVMETPGTKSINDAVKAGKALTRLCELYANCRESVSNIPK